MHVAGLDEHFERGVAMGFAGGASVEEGERLLLNRGYGLADWRSGLAMTTETIFDIGSVSKQFTAAAILRLQEQGRLSVSDPISRFFSSVPADKAGITIHQLLTHTSGLPMTSRRSYEARTRGEMISAVLAEPLRRAPGSAHDYSNAGYALLAAIIEIASGERLETFLRRELFDRAGMSRTGWTQFSRRGARFATGYNLFGGFPTPQPEQWAPDGPLWGYRGAGSLLSTMNDLRRWARALRRGRVLSASSMASMVAPQVREEPGGDSYYGYGIAISLDSFGRCRIGHTGSNNLHYTWLSLLPEHDIVVLGVSLQSHSPLRRLTVGRMHQILLGRTSELPPVPRAGAAAQPLAGRWRAPDGTELSIRQAGGRFFVPTNEPGAARLLSPFPALGEADEQVVALSRAALGEIVAGVSRGDLDPLIDRLSSETTAEEERRYWPGQWREWTDEHGHFQGSELVGSVRQGERLISYLLLRFSRRNIFAAAFHDAAGRIYLGNRVNVGPDVEIFHSELVFTPAGDGGFRLHNPNFPEPVEARLSPDLRRLTIRRPTGTTELERTSE